MIQLDAMRICSMWLYIMREQKGEAKSTCMTNVWKWVPSLWRKQETVIGATWTHPNILWQPSGEVVMGKYQIPQMEKMRLRRVGIQDLLRKEYMSNPLFWEARAQPQF